MKQIDLILPRERLFTEVSRTAAYLGAKQAPADDPGAHFDRVSLIDDDNALLSRFATEAVSRLAEQLRGLVTHIDMEGIKVSLSLSDSYDDCLTASAAGNFESYMSAAVTARWLRLVLPEKEGVWRDEAERLLGEITATLFHRNPPRRH